MPTRYVTLAPNTAATVTYTPGFDRVAVWHDGTVDGIVYVDLSGKDAVVPSNTDGTVDHTVRMVTRGARRVLHASLFGVGRQTALSLKSAAACRVELEF